jgi:transcription antitermination protein NusB
MLRPETRARARALQLLYAWEIRGRPALHDLVPGLARLTGPQPRVLDGAEALAQGVVDGVEALDQRIERAVAHWRLDRLGMGERLVLRIGTWELLRREVPPRVAIDEALWLARRFAGEDAVSLVNGVLDRIARELGVL